RQRDGESGKPKLARILNAVVIQVVPDEVTDPARALIQGRVQESYRLNRARPAERSPVEVVGKRTGKRGQQTARWQCDSNRSTDFAQCCSPVAALVEGAEILEEAARD